MVTENLHIRVCIINALNLSPKFTLITPIHKTLSASAPDTLSGSVPWTWWGTFIPPRDAPFSKSYSAPLSAYCVNNMPISRSLGKSAVVSASLALSPSLHVCVCVCVRRMLVILKTLWNGFKEFRAVRTVRSALSPVHTSNSVEATLSNATMSNVASTLLLV